MQAFTRLDGRAAPLSLANIDTDQIIPKQFLKTVEREGLAKGLFYDFRFDGEGNEIADFVLNRPEYKGSSVLIAGDNFGCRPWSRPQARASASRSTRCARTRCSRAWTSSAKP
jgi:3-isopropylmalate/(R)-2-methylmalate dehydratase small subunit